MASLEALPYDIKLTILLNITDYDTLTALVTTSRGFFTTFKQYKQTILNRVLLEDALSNYKAESLFIARFGIDEPRKDAAVPWPYTRDIIKPSYAPEKEEFRHLNYELWHQSQILDTRAEEETHEKIIANHRAILRHYGRFIRQSKYPRLFVNAAEEDLERREILRQRHILDGAPTTPAERERIVRGFYRLWMLSLLYSTRSIAVPEGTGEPWTDPAGIGFMQLVESLDFWDVKVVQILMTYLHEGLAPVFSTTLPDETILKQYFSTESASGCIGRSGDNATNYVDHHFVAFLMTDFPHNTAVWRYLDSPSRSPADEAAHQDFLAARAETVLASAISYANGSDDRTQNRLCRSIFLVDLVRDFVKLRTLDSSRLQKVKQGLTVEMDGTELSGVAKIPLKPLCQAERCERAGRFHLPNWPTVAKVTWLVLELGNEESQDSDYFAAVWDDWRLKRWGYHVPKFERRGYHPKRLRDAAVRVWRRCYVHVREG
ncbi:hypothetical protein DRE_03265 [Drechslerella stenobrocha 248]|uniref:F-box domain-containing protein n=1 Tax=Drechslerella stenobrocha 248 TaxID=1043628 RepID=W7IF17_9PEZI|nr:hypothetical protein DRE_03265 [Drechslerella stenobrocha 248]